MFWDSKWSCLRDKSNYSSGLTTYKLTNIQIKLNPNEIWQICEGEKKKAPLGRNEYCPLSESESDWRKEIEIKKANERRYYIAVQYGPLSSSQIASTKFTSLKLSLFLSAYIYFRVPCSFFQVFNYILRGF